MGAKHGINLKEYTYRMIVKMLKKKILRKKKWKVSGRRKEPYNTNLQFIATLHIYHDDDKIKAN